MQKRLFVGNLSFDAKEAEVKQFFSQVGEVESVSIIMDRRSGRPKGYAFVEMAAPESVARALELNGQEFMGRNMIVAEANPREVHSGDRGGRRGQFRWKKDQNRFTRHTYGSSSQSGMSWWQRLLSWFGFGSNGKKQTESASSRSYRKPNGYQRHHRTKIRSIYE